MQNHMKILFISNAPIDSYKGTEQYFINFGNFLKENGHEVFYLNNNSFNVIKNDIPETTKINFALLESNYKRIGWMFFPPYRKIKMLNPDVIYINTFTLYPFLPLHRKLHFIFGTHTLNHESFYKKRNRYKKGRYLKFKLLCFLSNFYNSKKITLHAVNEEQCRWLRTHGLARFNCNFAPLPVDCNLFKPNDLLWKKEEFDVLYVGALEEVKGIQEFLRVIEILSAGLDGRIRFKVVGSGSLSNLVKAKVLQFPNLSFLGKISDIEKGRIYNESSILVSPSKSENFHMVSAEALLCGLPVISTNLPGPRMLVEDQVTGSLLEESDPDMFSKEVLKYFDIWQNDKELYYKKRRNIAKIARSKKYCMNDACQSNYSLLVESVKETGNRKQRPG